jgi:RNA polymerase sigma-70 factor (ECF subfamily)
MHTDLNGLVERARSGSQAAAEELIDSFYEKIYAFLRRLVTNEADAADLTQRTFSGAWQSLPAFAGRSSLSSWLHSIAYHAFIDWRRRNSHIEPRSQEWWADQVSAQPGPDEIASRNDLAASLYASVDQLMPELRDTIHLHYYQELTLQETADAMGVATSTVKYRLRQALKDLETKFSSRPALIKSSHSPGHYEPV